jgi:hypothetical protein
MRNPAIVVGELNTYTVPVVVVAVVLADYGLQWWCRSCCCCCRDGFSEKPSSYNALIIKVFLRLPRDRDGFDAIFHSLYFYTYFEKLISGGVRDN